MVTGIRATRVACGLAYLCAVLLSACVVDNGADVDHVPAKGEEVSSSMETTEIPLSPPTIDVGRLQWRDQQLVVPIKLAHDEVNTHALKMAFWNGSEWAAASIVEPTDAVAVSTSYVEFQWAVFDDVTGSDAEVRFRVADEREEVFVETSVFVAAETRARLEQASYAWSGCRDAVVDGFDQLGVSEEMMSAPRFWEGDPIFAPDVGLHPRVLEWMLNPLDATESLLALTQATSTTRHKIRPSIAHLADVHQHALPEYTIPENTDFGEDNPIAAALQIVFELDASFFPDSTQMLALSAFEAELPVNIRKAIAALIERTVVAHNVVEAGNAQHNPQYAKNSMRDAVEIFGGGWNSYTQITVALNSPGTSTPTNEYAIIASLLLADAIDSLRELLVTETVDVDSWVPIETPIGQIKLAGVADDRHIESAALVVDLGGNDVYDVAASTLDLPAGVSWVIDVAGDDSYGGVDEAFSVASAIHGVAMLADLDGNDSYQSSHYAQGFGYHGVGLLYDAAGDDEYVGEALVQGAGLFGLGLLVDVSGSDRYETTWGGQGFGGVAAVGAIVDVAGDDLYEVRHVEYTYDAGYGEKWEGYGFDGHGYWVHSQASGMGIRSFTDGQPSFGGGIGLILDHGGDDVYTGVDEFGLAEGYYYGFGGLVDVAGNDTYDAWDYVTASSQHQGGAVLIDADGDDRYEGAVDHAQGHALDMSVAILVDLAGDDYYESHFESQGTAVKPAGVGALVDADGADVYSGTNQTNQGWARLVEADAYWSEPPVAVLIDLGGDDDQYSREAAADGETWWNELSTSIGVDVP